MMKRRHYTILFALVACTACRTAAPAASARTAKACSADRTAPGCACEPGDPECTGEAIGLYAPLEVIDVAIDVAPSDWDAIRFEGRTLPEVFSGCSRDPRHKVFAGYTWIPARVTVGGKTFPRARVRKKGFLGSLSTLRPSLKVDFAAERNVEDDVRGTKRLTLNNNRQDDSNATGCLAYAVFRAAGLPAPYCNLARVKVNGRDLGFFANVEPLKKPFLRRAFGDDDGALYEGGGQLADFHPAGLAAFEKKTDTDSQRMPELERVAAALAITDDAAMVEALKSAIEFDRFLDFWAVESLISHWDGYTGNNNNFYVYAPARNGKISFIPWGADGAFDRDHAWLPEEGRPKTVLANSRIARRLYAYPPTRAMYRAHLRRLLDEVWNERQLLAELDRIVAATGANPEGHAAKVREFIQTRRQELEAELARDPLPWSFPPVKVPACDPSRVTEASGTFESGFNGPFAPSRGTSLSIQYNGATYTSFYYQARMTPRGIQMFAAGFTRNPAFDPRRPEHPTDNAPYVPDGSALIVSLVPGPAPPAVGVLPLHGFEVFGVVSYSRDGAKPTPSDPFKYVGFIGDGAITLEKVPAGSGESPAAGAAAGAPSVKGRFSGHMVPFEMDVQQ